MNRRDFLLAGGAAAGVLFVRRPVAAAHTGMSPQAAPASTALDVAALEKFVDPLPIPPIARPAGIRHRPQPNTPYYRVEMRQVAHRVHRDVAPTKFWSFGSSFPGPTFEARSGEGFWIDWGNRLPQQHLFPIDHTIHGAGADVPAVRGVVHVHGARVPPEADGYPERWLARGQTAQHYYPNRQDAATLWYHDHTMGINRLNVYAGLMGAYVIRDDIEDALNLPSGRYDVPLLLCDRLFRADGQLEYPASNDPAAPWVPEAFGDVVLVNGKLFPYLDVESRKYRFRLINGSNGRFLRLEWSNGQRFTEIGVDQGLLEAPVTLGTVQLAPAERADVVVDFAGMSGAIVLTNDRQPILQLRVGGTSVRDTTTVPLTLRAMPRLREADAVSVRLHTLEEREDLLERPTRMLLNGMGWHMPVTEQPRLDTTEIWSLVNLTDDSHPIHLHLVRFQILDRRRFEMYTYLDERRLVFTGPPVPPDPAESGWKDTVRAESGMVTRIIIKFDGYPGRYMWHCHILEHGDNEMMRPFDVLA